jgi:hypothetical protein
MQVRSLIRSKPLFIVLLPCFFVLHGFTEHYNFISVGDASLLLTLYLAGMLIVTSVNWLFYRNLIKASVVSFCLMAIFFFFGSIQDLLRKYFAGSFLAKYSFILPLLLLLTILLMSRVKKARSSLPRLTLYLNILLLVLCGIDVLWLAERRFIQGREPGTSFSDTNLVACRSCNRPDIFFIIFDEYSGNTALKQLFHFDNSGFEKQLEQRGFYVAKQSCSNYNYTPFSVASVLNMRYLDLKMAKKAPGNIDYCYQQIRNSDVIKFLTANGYRFSNYSIFDFKDRPAINYDSFLPNNTSLITSQTFLCRVLKDISYNISTGKWTLNWGLKKRTYEHLNNNENVIRAIKEKAVEKTSIPKFVYAHLVMPHYPYYFDSQNRPLALQKLLPGQESDRGNYIQYLQYCNSRIVDLVDNIIANSDRPPVIMLLGDHGFREGIEREEHKYAFRNLNAVYLPEKNYDGFYDSISNVNQFRVLLNKEFEQHLPLLKDSTIFLWGD